ncbi:MAG: C39 family peptidase [Lachnospiraceae bacterium]
MYKIEVPYINQSEGYPTGCESVSAVMLLQFLGYRISVDTFIETCLEKQAMEWRAGKLYGPDPKQYFAGSPYDESEDSYGCYAPVICRALGKVMGEDYAVLDETGKPFSYLQEHYIDKGMPVIVWACINMREPITGPVWTLLDGKGEFTWISNEHCMLLVGYDEEYYYFNDPHENNGVIGYEKKIVECRHQAQHMQAVGVKKK